MSNKIKNQDFTTTILVENTPEEAFNVILNVRTWWSGLFDESFEGRSETVGDEFSFLAGGRLHYTKQKLVELLPNEKVLWLVTGSNLSFADTTDEWTGTKMCFEISRERNRTKIVFTR